MALFADEGRGSGIASSFSVRNIIWQPGAILAPMIGGGLMEWFGFGHVFWLASAFTVVGLVLMGLFILRFFDQVKEKR